MVLTQWPYCYSSDT